MPKKKDVVAFSRELDQCYISGRKFTSLDVAVGDVVYVDERPCFVGYHGVPQTEEWKVRHADRLQAERLAEEKRQEEMALWDDY